VEQLQHYATRLSRSMLAYPRIEPLDVLHALRRDECIRVSLKLLLRLACMLQYVFVAQIVGGHRQRKASLSSCSRR
jgi:hypothetical protein